MTRRMLTGWCVLGLCWGTASAGLAVDEPAPDAATPAAAPAPAPAPRVVRRKPAPVKLSASQVYSHFDTLEAKIDTLQKSLLTMPKSTGTPAVVAPGPGEGLEAKNMMSAFYNYGSYMKQAENKQLAASLIWDMTVLGGAIFAVQGWESSRDRYQPTPSNVLRYRHVPLTFKNSIPYYTTFTVGISTAVVGMMVSEFIHWSAISSEKQAAAALMHPLEAAPQTTP